MCYSNIELRTSNFNADYFIYRKYIYFINSVNKLNLQDINDAGKVS